MAYGPTPAMIKNCARESRTATLQREKSDALAHNTKTKGKLHLRHCDAVLCHDRRYVMGQRSEWEHWAGHVTRYDRHHHLAGIKITDRRSVGGGTGELQYVCRERFANEAAGCSTVRFAATLTKPVLIRVSLLCRYCDATSKFTFPF